VKGHTLRADCRLCGSRDLEVVVPLTKTPIGDAYVTREHLGEAQERYPVDLWFCRACHHVQLCDVVRPELLFRADYAFQSGGSPGIVKHFEEYTGSVLAKEKPANGSLAVDIGSNDGTFLRFFKEAGLKVLGVDPAADLVSLASSRGIETWQGFFDRSLAKKIVKERGAARIVSANNVFAHADDLGGMADAVSELLAPEGAFVFEVSYLVDVVDHMLLGSVFHEHLCYHSVRPLRTFLARHGLELVDVERNPQQGGSIVGTAQKKGGPRRVSAAVEELSKMELARGFDKAETFRAFSKRIEARKAEVVSLLDRIKSEKKTLAGFGAARGATTFVCHFGLGERLSFIADDSPAKQGLYSPGDHVPVLPSSALYEKKPDYCFILAWVHAKHIIEKHKAFLEQGGRFVTAFPALEVVEAARARA
jgi:hypothetical protein